MSERNGLLSRSSWIIIILFVLTSAYSTNYCQVYEHKIKYEYDMRKIMSHNIDIIVVPKISEHSDTIRMQLCSPLKKKCNNKDGYAICVQYENGTEKGIGKFPPKVSAKRGQITFTFSGSFCYIDPYDKTPNINYTIKIFLQCDYQASSSRPIIEYFNRLRCRIYMLWKTVLACAPRKEIHCADAYNHEHYDLTLLTKYSENYKVHARGRSSGLMEFNVCHSVIRNPGAACPSDAGACIYNKELKRYINLGNVQSPLIIGNGHILLEYENGDLCNVSDVSSRTAQRYKTSIIFSCSMEETLHMQRNVPEFAEEMAECHFQILWKTDMACSIETLLGDATRKASICTLQHPASKSEYNLQLLMGKEYTIHHGNKRYELSICEPLKNERCKAETGVCDTKSGLSYGKANAKLLWDSSKDAPYLVYNDGDICPSNGCSANTTILFFCGRNISYSPIVVETRKCDLSLYWRTNLVCNKEVSCNIDYFGNDLSPLIQYTENYVTRHKNLVFHINVCLSLVFIPGLECEHGVAACVVELDSKNQVVRSLNLGYRRERPTLNRQQHIVLRYTEGMHCRENRYKRLSTNITFICSNRQQDYPSFKRYVDCTYQFEWNTTLACISARGIWNPPCIVQNRFRNLEYDLSKLYQEQRTHYVYSSDNKEYSINICHNKNYCNGSAVCDRNNSYGSVPIILCDHKKEGIILTYMNGNKCDRTAFYTSRIRLVCNEYVGIGTPMLRKESKCSVEFEWETEVACTKSTDWKTVKKGPHNTMSFIRELFTYENRILVGILMGFVLGATVVAICCCRNRSQFFNRIFHLTNYITYDTPNGDTHTLLQPLDHDAEYEKVIFNAFHPLIRALLNKDADPADPTDPTVPTDPMDPTEPTDPSDLSDPTDPPNPPDPSDVY